MGGSWHHFGPLLWVPWGSLGRLWMTLGRLLAPLWPPFASPWLLLATTWVHFGNISDAFGFSLEAEGSLLHVVGRCGVLAAYFVWEFRIVRSSSLLYLFCYRNFLL